LKKRKLTAAQKKLNRIRAANRRVGWLKAADHYRARLADEREGLRQYYAAYGESQRRVRELEAAVAVLDGARASRVDSIQHAYTMGNRDGLNGRTVRLKYIVGVVRGEIPYDYDVNARDTDKKSAWETICEGNPQ
jgi:hypothetical protein